MIAIAEFFSHQVTVESMTELFSKEVGLIVPLGEVVLLVVVVNLFALFKKPRLIMATSYLFCLKWVFWSNYTELLKQSSTVTVISTCVFVLCGILTAVLFFLNNFNSD